MKVAIIGTARGYDEAPYDDPSYECWGLNSLYNRLTPHQLARITRWFELHPYTENTRSRRPADHWDSLAALGKPVYSFYEQPGITDVRILDVEKLAAVGRRYFACTMAYQIALALSEGATHIELYGISLAGTPREMLIERPCVEWWLGLAEGRGVQVKAVFTNESGILKHPYCYALEDLQERTEAYRLAFDCLDYGVTWLTAEAVRLEKSQQLELKTSTDELVVVHA